MENDDQMFHQKLFCDTVFINIMNFHFITGKVKHPQEEKIYSLKEKNFFSLPP